MAASKRSRLIFVVLVCFFFSGLTSLAYEILWMRMITRVVGGAPFAVSMILTIFMGGLGLGGFLAGRWIDRVNRPFSLLGVYGGLELLIGLYALAIPFLLSGLEPLFAVFYNRLFTHALLYHLLIFIGCLALLIVPVVCMGATLPVLCRFYISALSHLGRRAGLLYGLNTIGGAAGALLCGFFLVRYLGPGNSLKLVVLTNILIGVVCLLIARGKSARGHGSDFPDSLDFAGAAETTGTQTSGLPPMPESARREKRRWQGALILFAVSGFCAMAYEVIWTRLLGLLVGPTTYSFTIVLVVFISGLALGNMVFGRLADRSRNPMALLVGSQVAAALFALGVSQLTGNSQLFFAKLLFSHQDNFPLMNLLKGLSLFAFLLPPTLCLGASFPLVGKIYTRHMSRVGRSIGLAYGVNTLGAVSGAFCAGFLLIPAFGKETALSLIVALQVVCAFGVWAAAGQFSGAGRTEDAYPGPRRFRWGAAFAFLAVCGVLCTAYPAWNRHLLALGKYHRFGEIAVKEAIENTGWMRSLFAGADLLAASERGELLYYGDGIGGFISVLRYPGALGGHEYSLATSGKMDASSRGDMTTQTLLAHAALLFHPEPENVMVLGLASGITAGEVLHYPVKELDILEINKQSVDASRFFKPWNNNVLESPKTRLILQDGLAHLQFTRKRYDVIISEPSNPWMAGMASLFTRDFFQLARERLNAGGIYAQWFHCYQMDWPTLALVGRSFASVFPDSVMINTEPSGSGRDFLLLGFKGEAGLALSRARQNLRFLKKSGNIRLPRAELFYRLLVTEDLKGLFGPGPVHSRQNPVLEFAAPRHMYEGSRAKQTIMKKIRERRQISPEKRRIIKRLESDVTAQIDYASFALSLYAPFSQMVDLSRADKRQRAEFQRIMTDYCRTNPVNYAIFRDEQLRRRCRRVQMQSIQNRLPDLPDPSLSHAYLGTLYLDRGETDKAIARFRRSLTLNPEDADLHNNLGSLLAQKGETGAAMAHYRKAIAIKPYLIKARSGLAGLCLRRGDLDGALEQYKQVIEARPDLPEARLNAALVYARKNAHEKAIREMEQALRVRPDWIEGLNTMAWLLANAKEEDKQRRRARQAVAYAEKACELTDYKNPLILYTLSIAHAASAQWDKSMETAESALSKARAAGRQKLAQTIDNHMRRLRLEGMLP